MSIKNSFINDIKELMANVQPKPDAEGYYKDLDNVEADLISNYSSCFEELATYEGLDIPKVDDASVLEGIKKKLRNNTAPELINGLCVGVDCPDYLYCDDCIFSKDNRSALMRYLGIDPTEPQVKELPKLTVEIFDRPDCPEWAMYAAVDKDGGLYFYRNEPSLETSAGEWSYFYGDNKWGRFDDNFDASDWQNSLIERPKKQEQLPDWVKVGAVGYDDMNHEYFEVIEVNNDSFRAKYIGSSNPCSALYFNEFVSEARKRPFNEKEMRALVGKVITDVEGDATLITDFDNVTKHIRFLGEWWQSDELADSTWKLDDKPCYKLQHLNEKGEWVE